MSIIGAENRHRYMIATQDKTLKAYAAQLLAAPESQREHKGKHKPTDTTATKRCAVPVISVSNNMLVLNKPNDADVAEVERTNTVKMQPLVREQLAIAKVATALKQPVNTVFKKKKKYRVKEPNPLSCLKKKKKVKSQITADNKHTAAAPADSQ